MAALTWLPPPCDLTTSEKLRLWVVDLFDKITSHGLVQTADTGQLVPASANVPSTGGNSGSVLIGYWVFRFNDTLQATAPIFLRVEIRVMGNVGSHIPGFSVTIGSGSNGAGVITGLSTTLASTGDITATTPSLPSLVVNTTSTICSSNARGFFGILYQPGQYRGGVAVVRSPMAFCVSRTQAADGTPTSDGVSLFVQANTPAASNATVNWTNTYLQTSFLDFVAGSVTTAPTGTAVPFLTLPTIRDGKYVLQRAYHHGIGAPCHNLLLYPVSLSDSEISVVSGGTEASKFKLLGTQWAGRPSSLTTTFALAMFYE